MTVPADKVLLTTAQQTRVEQRILRLQRITRQERAWSLGRDDTLLRYLRHEIEFLLLLWADLHIALEEARKAQYALTE